MRIYYCQQPYFGGFANEPMPSWPQDYELAGDLAQGQLEGKEALEHAFSTRNIRLGDVIALNDGSLHRCEMDGWTQIGTLWRARRLGGSRRKQNDR